MVGNQISDSHLRTGIVISSWKLDCSIANWISTRILVTDSEIPCISGIYPWRGMRKGCNGQQTISSKARTDRYMTAALQTPSTSVMLLLHAVLSPICLLATSEMGAVHILFSPNNGEGAACILEVPSWCRDSEKVWMDSASSCLEPRSDQYIQEQSYERLIICPSLPHIILCSSVGNQQAANEDLKMDLFPIGVDQSDARRISWPPEGQTKAKGTSRMEDAITHPLRLICDVSWWILSKSNVVTGGGWPPCTQFTFSLSKSSKSIASRIEGIGGLGGLIADVLVR